MTLPSVIEPPPLAGIVLCGGRSNRMGRDKALIEFEGEPLVVRVARRLCRAADPVLLAPGRPGRLGALGFAEVADAKGDEGPLAGIVAGLAASPHELMAVVAVDMPYVSADLLSALAAARRGEDAVVAVSSNGPEPAHAVYAAGALPQLRTCLDEGKRSLRAVLSELRVRWVPQAEWKAIDPTGRFAMNVNRVEDVTMMQGELKGGGRT